MRWFKLKSEPLCCFFMRLKHGKSVEESIVEFGKEKRVVVLETWVGIVGLDGNWEVMDEIK